MKKISILVVSICSLLFLQTISDAAIITTDIYISNIVHDDFGVDLAVGDTIGTFSFDSNTPTIDRDASNYNGMPEGIPTDTFVNYNPAADQYNGSIEASWDREYYDFSISDNRLPFQFNLELDTYVQSFNIEGIVFDTNTNYLSLDHSRGIEGYLGMMHTNFVIMGNGSDPYDFENFAFEYQIRYSGSSLPTPVPEPKAILLFFMGGIVIIYRKIFRKSVQGRGRNFCFT